MKLICWIVGIFLLMGCANPSEDDSQNEVVTNNSFQKLNELIEQDSNNLEFLLIRAELALEKSMYERAIDDLIIAKRLAPKMVSIRHKLADAYLDYYRSREAIREMEEAFETFPDSVHTALKLCEFQFILKKYDESLKTIGAILKDNPTNAEAYFMMGQNFKEKLDTPRAINSFQTAVEFDNELMDGWIELGNLFLGLKNPIAVQYFDNAVRLDSNDVVARFSRAYYYQETGQFLEAIKEYEHIISIKYDYADAFLSAGILYLSLDSLEQAYKKFDQLELLDRSNPRPYYYKGVIYDLNDQPDQAKSLYEQALRLEPTYEEARQALNNLE